MAQMNSWQAMLQKEHYEKVLENVSEIPRPPYFPPLQMSSDQGTLGIRWENWIDRFDNFLDALDIQKEHVKRAMLFYYVGDEVCEVFSKLPMTGGDKDYELAKTRLSEHFVPMQDNVYETHTFRKLMQEKGETIKEYETRLREYANRCHFEDTDKQIKSRLILTCNQTRLRRRAQKEPSLTLQDILSIGQAIELEQIQEKKTAEEKARESIASLHPTRSSKGTLELDESKTKCWGKLFKSCAGKDRNEESDDEDDGPDLEPKEPLKVVLLEMTPQMRQIRELKKSQSMSERNQPVVETKDDMAKPLIEDEPQFNPYHRYSVDELTSGVTEKKPRTPRRKARDSSKSPAKAKREKAKVSTKEGEEESLITKEKESVKSHTKGKKPSSPKAEKQEIRTESPTEHVAGVVNDAVASEKVHDKEKPASPTKRRKSRSPSPSKKVKEGPPSPKKELPNSQVNEGAKGPTKEKDNKTSKDGEPKKGRRRRKSKDKADDKKGILKKEPIEITITAPDDSEEVVSLDVSDDDLKVVKQNEKGEKHEKHHEKHHDKGKVTFSKDTKEPVVGKYDPDNDNDPDVKDKNVDHASADGVSASEQSKEESEQLPKRCSPSGSPRGSPHGSPKKTRRDKGRRRPSKDLM